MNMIYLIIAFLSVFFIMISCGEKDVQDREAISIVYDKALYLDDVIKYLPANLSADDSVLFVNNFVNQWAHKQLLYHEAKRKLKDTSDIIDKIEKYRKELYVYQYINNELLGDFDFDISKEDIVKYYNNNLSEFVLNQTYVKAHYLTMSANVGTYFRERNAVMETEPENFQDLIDFADGTGRRVYLLDEWVELNELLRKINYEEEFNEDRLKYENLIDNVDLNLRYLVKINDFRLKGDTTPIELVEHRILDLLVNKKRKEIVDQTKTKLFTDAVNQGSVVINLDN